VLPASYSQSHQGRWQAAVEWAKSAGRKTLEYFQGSNFEVVRKSDASPVTVADQQAETHIRAELAKHFPGDGILGEEFGTVEGTSGYQWIIDPIDGTKSFIYGVPLYATLIGLLFNDEPVAGVIYIPGLDELVHAAVGQGAYHHVAGRTIRPAKVASHRTLREGLFVTSQVDTFDKRNATAAFQAIQSRAYVTRTWGDAYGYLLVATGRAEVMVDPKVSPWDVAAVLPVIEEAGGRFTDWLGRRTVHGGDGVATNGPLHAEVLELLKS
jgi:histidinol phosphatase-like enzyme (inositol monophosphatase family)